MLLDSFEVGIFLTSFHQKSKITVDRHLYSPCLSSFGPSKAIYSLHMLAFVWGFLGPLSVKGWTVVRQGSSPSRG